MRRLYLLALTLFAFPIVAQAQLYQETFETDGNPARYTTSVAEFTDGTSDYFTRTDGSNIGGSNVYNTPEGSFFFAAQDLDGEGGPITVSLTITGINITGASALEFRGLFAEDDDGANQDWDTADGFMIEAQIDGGGFTQIFGIESDIPTNGEPRVDSFPFDGVGDGVAITDTFQELTAAITGTGAALDLRFTFTLNSGDEDLAIDDLRIFDVGGTDTSVQFTMVGQTVNEGDGTATLTVSISNEDGGVATTADVVLISGDITDLDNYTTQMVTFPAASSANQTVTVTITDDGDIEGDEDFVFQIQNVAGGNNAAVGVQDQHTLTVEDNDFADFVVINEVDADTPGTDDMEFIELYDGGVGNANLDGLVVVLVNGSDDLSYNAFDLDGFSTDGSGFFVLGDAAVVPTPGLVIPDGSIQNGPDAVALYIGNAVDFPNDTDVAPFAADQIDVVVLGTSDSRDSGLLMAVGATVQHEEDYHGLDDTESLQRMNVDFGGSPASRRGGAPFSELFYALAPTPGALNPEQITVNRTADVDDLAGWRMLASPLLQSGSFFDVDDYAAINLVQGVPAGATNPQQYPAAADNLFPTYNGDGTYTPPADTDETLPPGEGFFWYWYDNDLDPSGGGQGTSVSYDLSNPLFQLELTGKPLDETATVAHAPSADGFFMMGNPFAYPLYLGGVAIALDLDSPAPPNASSGVSFSSVFNVWNPGAGSYSILTADFGDPPAGDILPVWNGAFAEISRIPPDEAVNFIMDAAFVDPTSNDQLIGREGAGESRIAFTLAGDTESGAHVQDLAAMLRFRDDATLGWDLHDGSKLPAFGAGATALLAPVGERDGQPRRQSARSLPLALDGEVVTPLAFLASEAGDYEIAWNLIDLPAEWFATLRDAESGAEVNMVAESSYVFTADATDWTERFSVTVSPFATANEPTGELPNGYALSSVYPNPFNPQARFTLQVAQTQDVTVSVFDLLGRRVMDLHQGVLSAGTTHAFTLNGRDLASGFYVVRVSGETFSDSRRVTLLK